MSASASRWGARLLLLALWTPSVAGASDFSGVVTIVVGLPALIVADGIAAGLLFATPRRWMTWTTGIVLVPVWVAGIWLSPDALALFRGTWTGVPFGVLYFALLAVLAVLVVKLLTRTQEG